MLQADADSRVQGAEQQIATLRSQLEAARSSSADGAPVMVPASEPAPVSTTAFGLGREALQEEIVAWDVDILPDGRGLPVGSGDV